MTGTDITVTDITWKCYHDFLYKAWNKDSESVLYHGVMLVWKQEWETTHASWVNS